MLCVNYQESNSISKPIDNNNNNKNSNTDPKKTSELSKGSIGYDFGSLLRLGDYFDVTFLVGHSKEKIQGTIIMLFHLNDSSPIDSCY